VSDLTNAGNPAQERNERIRRRKMEVQLLRLKAAVIDGECDVEQMEASLETKKAQVLATQQQVAELERQIKEDGENG
jgi:hypothetical protein